MGNKARERETGRERFGERGRETQRWEKTAWVDFDCWSKSATPAKAQHVRISRGCQSIRTMEGLDINKTLGGVLHSLTIFGSTTFAWITLGLPQYMSDQTLVWPDIWSTGAPCSRDSKMGVPLFVAWKLAKLGMKMFIKRILRGGYAVQWTCVICPK